MAIYRTMPDGSLRVFPDGTSEAEIIKAMNEIAEAEKTDGGMLKDTPDWLKNNWLFDNTVVAPYEASRKGINSITNLTEGLGDTLGEKLNVGGFRYGKNADNGLMSYHSYNEAVENPDKPTYGVLSPITGQIGVKDALNIKGFFYDPDNPDNNNHTVSMTGKFVEGVGQFLIGLKGVDKLFKLGKFKFPTTKTGKFAEITTKGAIADFTIFDEQSGRFTDLLSEYAPETVDTYLGYLKSDPNDTWWEGRMKNAIEGIGLGSVAEVVFRMGRVTKNGISKRFQEKQASEDMAVIKKFDDTLTTIKDQLENTKTTGERMKVINEATDSFLKKEFKIKKPLSQKDTTTVMRNLADASIKTNFAKWQKGEITSEEAFNIPDAFINLDTFKAKNKKGGLSLEGMKTFKSFYDAIYKYNKKMNKVMTDEAVKRKASYDYGGNISNIFQDFGKFADNIDDTNSLIFAHEVALTSLMNAFPKFVRKYKAGDGGYTSGDMEMMYFMLDNMMNNAKRVRTATGRNLRVFQLTKEEFDNARIVEDQLVKDINSYKNYGGGQKGWERFLDQVSKADNPTAIRKIINFTWRNKTWNVLNEYWINALLSSPKTQMVNATSNGVMMALRPIEEIIGNKISEIISGSNTAQAVTFKRQLDESVTTLSSLSHYLGDANRYFVEAFKQGDQILQKGDISAGKIDTATTKSIPKEFGGEIIRLPSRFLNATDEWFKQINYRSKLHGIAVREGKKQIDAKNIKAKDLDKWVDEFIRQGYDESGVRGINEEAMRYAEENTFTNELVGITAKFQEMIIANPFLKQFFPFVKTPFNIAKAVVDRTPFAAIYRSSDLLGMSGNPLAIAKARGQFAIGSVILGSAYMLASNGHISSATNYRGDGKNLDVYTDRELLRLKKSATGFKQYSVKIGDKQYHFGQLDPFGAMFGLMADFVNIYDRLSEEEIERIGFNTNMALANADADLNWLQKGTIGVSALVKAGQNNILGKTYLKAMADIIDAINSQDGNRLERYISQKAGSFVPNIFKKFVNDPYYRDARQILDKTITNMGGTSVSPRYNAIGEPHMDKDSFGTRLWKNTFNILGTQKLRTDIVAQEFLRMGKGLSNMKPVQGNVDWRKFKTDKGVSAWDRLNQKLSTIKIDGKTLRQTLEEEIKSSDYQTRNDVETIAQGITIGTDRQSKFGQLDFIFEKFKQEALLDMENEWSKFKSEDDKRQTLDLAMNNMEENMKILKEPRDINNPIQKGDLKPIMEFAE